MAVQASCMELALEGERLCKAGDCRAGVSFFEAAVQVGTEDLKTLSAVYSQLGNAYFYLQEYEKALEFHRHDLTLARTLGDRVGEAKASGNLGNTLKVLGKFDEAIVCCTRHLDISRELGDKVGEARALYNLGNIYHAKGKHFGRSFNQDPGDFPEEVRSSLERAVEFYEGNLSIVKLLGDRAAQGRACGNLGNTHYLLGNFDLAIMFHEERLAIAREFNDKSAERRACSNLGNAHVFLGEFEIAAEYYKRTLQISKELGDRAIEAQACYSLGNTYTLLKEYNDAVAYHIKHLAIAQELGDRVGEGRACWSLGNAHTALGNHELALEYAQKHYDISKEVGDRTGQITAQMNISDLKALLGIQDKQTAVNAESEVSVAEPDQRNASPGSIKQLFRKHSKNDSEKRKDGQGKERSRKLSSPVAGSSRPVDAAQVQVRVSSNQARGLIGDSLDDNFFDMLSRYQGQRMNEQRCDAPSEIETKSKSADDLLELVARIQGDRMDEQRFELRDPEDILDTASQSKPVIKLKKDASGAISDDLYEIVLRSQAHRIEDQRSEPPLHRQAPTVPDEDFFGLILRLQSNRMDDQRSSLPGNIDRYNHK
ncbi:G-protein-signaling modulator 2-like [Actinia tenebrosa]|uniref:G-protein-signaling modulator 2-like n=1 Tax=Actinia tenebrosa TaxID=6105 RepID=A0A6P8IPR8_ACTTE|nr:G-protein-signaling modulator 2-like [Actinia tenebrosa]